MEKSVFILILLIVVFKTFETSDKKELGCLLQVYGIYKTMLLYCLKWKRKIKVKTQKL